MTPPFTAELDRPLLAKTDDPRATPLRLEVVSTLDQLAELEADWNRLMPLSAAPFQSFGWISAWYHSFPYEFDSIAIFVFREGTDIVGILPAYRKGSQVRLAGDTVCDYQDLIALDTKRAAEMLGRLIRYAGQERLQFHFEKLSETGVLWETLTQKSNQNNFLHFYKLLGPCPWFELPESSEALIRSLSKSRRKGIKNNMNRLKRNLPGSTYRFLTGTEITPEIVDRIGDLHSRNQFRKSGDSIFDSPGYRKFISKASSDTSSGLFLLLLETAEGEIIAMDLGMIRNGRFYSYVGSYEEKFSDSGPGTCQFHHLTSVLIERDVTIFDFLCGAEHYKFAYASHHYRVWSSIVLPDTPKNRVQIAFLGLKRQARLAIKNVMIRLKVYNPPFQLDLDSRDQLAPPIPELRERG